MLEIWKQKISRQGAQVLPLMPEEICNSDGAVKQDCEINAGKCFIRKLRKDHPNLKITLSWDGITSKQPMVEVARKERMNFLLVAKPAGHSTMMEWFFEQKKMGEVKTKTLTDENGRTHFYEWINQIPLNGNKDTVLAFYCHQIAELTDSLYQAVRKKCGSKREMWETVRTCIKFLIFDSMEMLFQFVLMPSDF